MEAGGKECEEETLQTAFKKLRVDAESLSGAVSASEGVTPRSSSRACLDINGAKPKHACQKDNWHGSTRKSSRGASRTQRRRRSKSPILQPPKFTYCSTAVASSLSPPSNCVTHQHLVTLEPSEPCLTVEKKTLSAIAQTEPLSSCVQSHITAMKFGTSDVCDMPPGATASSIPEAVPSVKSTGEVQPSKESSTEKSACDGVEKGASLLHAEALTFRELSELNRISTSPAPCVCSHKSSSDTSKGKEDTSLPEPKCCCQLNPSSWNNVEVYSFTGLRNVLSECERATQNPEDTLRTVSTNSNVSQASPSSGSARSCSEQARAYVDDITIEDLSGYLEYYLYIPKKMSHMAEMMYT